MCIFSRPIISVNNTQIFARLTGKGSQYLAYQMQYNSKEENAMILPIPVRSPSDETQVRFIDLQEYEFFFADLARGFPFIPPSFNLTCSQTKSACDSLALKVHNVGNYIASFVPTIDDFDRLDARFTLPKETWQKVPQYSSFGFAVFQLASGALEPHPMAFEFESNADSIFFPTMHIHDGEVHETEGFDHVLYMQHAGLDSKVNGYVNSDVADRATGYVRSKKIANEFCNISSAQGMVEPQLLVHRHIIRGNQPNRDVEISVIGDALKPSFNHRPYLRYLPWIVAVSAVAWFFRRRNRIKRSDKHDSDSTV